MLDSFHAERKLVGLTSNNENCSISGSWTGTKYKYDAFRNMTDSGGNFVNPYRYTAREWDGETGLYYYRARYYDPSVGRFISEDPIQFAGGGNFYAYVGNDPVNFVDPSGRLAELYCETISIFTGGVVRASEKAALAGLGFRPMHCFLRIACNGQDEFWELEGPKAEIGGGKYGVPMITKFNKKRTDSWFTHKIAMTQPSGMKCCEFEQKLKESFFSQVKSLPPYSPTGPNSNTFVLDLIKQSGGSASLPFPAVH